VAIIYTNEKGRIFTKEYTLTGFTLKSNPLPSERSGRGSRSAMCLVGVGDVLGLGMYDAEAAVVTRVNTVSVTQSKRFINVYVPISMYSGGERRAKEGNSDKNEIRRRAGFETWTPFPKRESIFI
jgi:hypothetical protein